MAYVNGAESRHEQPVTSCPLCDVPERNDEEALILCRGRHAYVVLNRYPYNNGHLMVVPFRHLADYAELTARESLEMCRLTRQAVKVLRTLIGAQGFNIGMNLGETGGAGIADHLHQHVVPRWQSDTNFMPVLGRTAVLPQLLEETWATLAQGWA
jgi:ATP adenylyltransferase